VKEAVKAVGIGAGGVLNRALVAGVMRALAVRVDPDHLNPEAGIGDDLGGLAEGLGGGSGHVWLCGGHREASLPMSIP